MPARLVLLALVLLTSCAERSAQGESARPTAPDVEPWRQRIEAEQAAASRDPRYTPRIERALPVLEAPGALRAIFERSGTTLMLDERRSSLGVSAIGRADRLRPIAASAPEIVGLEVQRALGAGIVEWWRALPCGLEHGVTLDARPGGGEGPLLIDVAIDGELEARPALEGSVALVDERGLTVARYAHLLVIDAAGAALPASMDVVGERVRLTIDDRGARYPVVVDPLIATPEATLAASDAAGSDRLGLSVALSSDGTRALVGAPYDDTAAGADAGTARVFVRTGATWMEEATLVATDGAALDYLGFSVALSADGAIALVGARYDDTAAGANAGSARVFVRSGTSWTEEATLLASDAAAGDLLGGSVALSEDGRRALVGAYLHQGAAGLQSGSAYVFERSGTSWAETGSLEGAGLGDWFGWAVALSGDGSRALIGAPSDDHAGLNGAGSARVFAHDGSGWVEEATLISPSPASSDAFGDSVALSPDGTRAIVGASRDDRGALADAGSAQVFVRSGTSWAAEGAILRGSAADENLGTAVSLAAGGARAFVSGPYVQNGGAPGSVRLYSRVGSTWSLASTLTPSGSFTNDFFGVDLAVSLDGLRLLVGMSADAGSGSARVFTLPLVHGAACTSGAECESGACVDGVCCAGACGGGADDCMACAAAMTGAADGVCAPLSAAMAPAVTCRASAGACDVAETCQPSSTACPADGFVAAATECRPSAGDCDVAEACTGTSGECPADAFVTAGIECRPSAGDCDVAEVCGGTSAACPADALVAAGIECRGSAGDCDVAEVCGGTSAACPADAFVAAGMECRGSAGDCDVAEVCGGTSAACPADALVTAGIECRAAAGDCDVAEACDGASASCPADALAPATLECRAASCSSDVETLAATCSGGDAACPAATTQPCVGYVCGASACLTACTSDLECASDHFCDGGACAADRSQGSACAEDRECASGACADGVCCESACDGQCEACAEPGSEGLCVAVTGAPREPRAACASDGSACGGACDGSDRVACAYPGGGAACGAARCDGDVRIDVGSCDGEGACIDPAPEACELGCEAGACVLCAGDAQCGAGRRCVDGGCVDDLDAGVIDAGRDDGGADAEVALDAATPDASLLDASILDAGSDAGLAPPAVGGCGCHVAARQRPALALGVVGLVALATLARRRRSGP